MVLTLREALKSLCSSNGWSYAVFWRLKSPNRMILTWEDGHYESTKPAGISNISTFIAPGSFVKNWESGGDLLDYGIRSQDGCSKQDQIELLVSKMSQQMHSLQEGIVGSIASSGKHQWIIMENLLREWSSLGPLNPCSSFEYPDGWQTQLAAGIKTIAFIAAAPYGVVQLGSKQTIIEDLELVTRVKNLFGSVNNLSRPDSQDSVQELLSGRIHGTRFLPGYRSGIVLHGIPKQSMLKNSSLNVSEQGGDSFSLLATSKGIPACSSSSFAKSISQFSQLQQKAMQLSGFTSSHNNDHETLLKESRILPSARVIYPLQGMLQASSCEAGNRQSLINCSRTKELGLQGQRPVLSINGQSPINTKAEEASFQSVWLDMGPPLTSALEQTEIPSSVPALQDVLAQTECSISSSAPVMNANQLEQMGRKVEHLAGLDSSHPSYKDPIHSAATIQAPLSAVMDRCCTSWGMTSSSGQHGTALQETVGNHVMPSSLGGDFISAAFGIGSHSWEKDLTAKDASPLFPDVMVDDLYPENENCKDLEVPFGEVTTVTDECAGFDDAKFLTKGQENCTNSIVLPAVDELFDVLHPAFKKCKTQDQVIWDDILLPVSNGSNPNFISHSVGIPASLQCPSRFDILHSFDSSMDRGFEGGFYSDRKSENLLDAVVANIRPPVNHSTKEIALSNITFSGLNGATSLHGPSVKTNSCLSGTLSSSDKSEYVGLSRCGDNTSLNCIQSFLKSGFQGETSAKTTSNNTCLKSQLSSWIEDSKSSKDGNFGLSQAKKSDEPVKVNRKRAKPGESTRPRPKDRQQIQDRVKELREIVPNGSKCSIDALLERTIKHMLFLQSVTKHADKLKHSGEQKGFYKDILLGKDNLEGGASWALEVAGQSMGCPIIVENMSQPRQMLVEMLCEERGLFLEIADIIRGLGLTILKGVMEARKDKIWARFAVEANRDVHRVEILWSLMQLLQQNTKNTTSASSQPR